MLQSLRMAASTGRTAASGSGGERPQWADSAMQVDLSVELKDRSVDLYFCSNEWPL
jgi:hypothetical protein